MAELSLRWVRMTKICMTTIEDSTLNKVEAVKKTKWNGTLNSDTDTYYFMMIINIIAKNFGYKTVVSVYSSWYDCL